MFQGSVALLQIIQNEAKKQKGGFLSISLSTLDGSY